MDLDWDLIWRIHDTDQDGSLSLEEFLVAVGFTPDNPSNATQGAADGAVVAV